MAELLTLPELSKATGVPKSTLLTWVERRHLRPAVSSFGKGDAYRFTRDAVAQVRAIAAIREEFGDGRAARLVIEQAVPVVRESTRTIRIPTFELALPA